MGRSKANSVPGADLGRVAAYGHLDEGTDAIVSLNRPLPKTDVPEADRLEASGFRPQASGFGQFLTVPSVTQR
jgi:hypothetical protein